MVGKAKPLRATLHETVYTQDGANCASIQPTYLNPTHMPV
jgi:hypothetical protein